MTNLRGALILFLFANAAWAQNLNGFPPEIADKQDVINGTQAVQDALGERDPFLKPKYIRELEEAPAAKAAGAVDNIEDDRVEAIRRWPLSQYKPIAVIWDVQNPKVMIVDKRGTMHLLRKKYRIGNQEGIITAINEGEIVVNEKGIVKTLQIAK